MILTGHTEKGLGFFSKAFIFVIISSIITITVAVASLVLLTTSHDWNDSNARIARTITSIASVIATILSIIIVIFYLFAADFMYKGKDVHGEKHSRSVTFALVFMVISILLIMPYYASSYIFALKSGMTSLAMKDTLLRYVIASFVLGLLYYIFISLFLTYMVQSLVRKQERRRLNHAILTLITTQVIGSLILFGGYLRVRSLTNPTLENISPILYFTSGCASLLQFLFITGFYIFIVIYQRARIQVRSEESGLDRPDGSARKEKVIYAEPISLVESERRTSLIYTTLAIVGLVSCFAFMIAGAIYYPDLVWSWAFLLVMGILFCIWETYVWLEQHITRTRFRVYDNAIVPSYIPFSYAFDNREYSVPFSKLRGMSLLRRERKEGGFEWRCQFLLDDGRPVEFYGSESEDGFYNFLKDIKESYNLQDYNMPPEDDEDLRNRVSKEYREQLRRWGIRTKEKNK